MASWRDTPTTRTITDFVAEATTEGEPLYLPDPQGLLRPVVEQVELVGVDDLAVAVLGRRPTVAAASSNGDLPTLQFAGRDNKPALRLVVRHDDPEREFDAQSGAENVLGAGFTEVGIRDDWSTVFGG